MCDNSQNSPTVYVLIRTNFRFRGLILKNKDNKRRKNLEYFSQCLNSVFSQVQDGFSLKVIVLQNGCIGPKTPTHQTKLPRRLIDILKTIRVSNKPDNFFLYRTWCKGAGRAQYLIRQVALNLTKECENAIFIQLDHDDYFTDNQSIKSIVEQFKDNDIKVCITGYNVVGDKSKDITNQAGSVHNELLRRKGFGMSLAHADSLGWTKSYRKEVICNYQESLKACLGGEAKLLKYFKKNDTFEDFMDVITLCRKKCEIAFLDKATHSYRKHEASITSTSNKEQFKQRVEALALTVKLLKEVKEKETAEKKEIYHIITKFCIVKILLIENILAKFRKDEHNEHFQPYNKWKPSGFGEYSLFPIYWVGYTLFYIYKRVKNIWFRYSENGSFFNLFIEKLEDEKLLEFFADCANELTSNDRNKGNNLSSDTIPCKTAKEKIEEACKHEANKAKIDITNLFITKGLMQNATHKRSFNVSLILNLFFIFLTIYWFIQYSIDKEKDIVSVAATISIAIISFCANRIVSLRSKRNEDNAKIEIYLGEIKDFSRHLLANLNVLKNIEQKLEQELRDSTKSKRKCRFSKVGAIHFTNIKLPDDSILLSNDPMQHALFDDLNDIARFKVNIRNINNSAVYLEKVAQDGTIKELHEAVQWEIVRHIVMLIQAKFFEENRNFKMPSLSQLKIYVKVKHIREYIASELAPKNEKPRSVGMQADIYKKSIDNLIKFKNKYESYVYVDNMLERYYADQEKERETLIFENTKYTN